MECLDLYLCLYSYQYLYLYLQTDPEEGAAEISAKTELDVKKHLFNDAQTNTVSSSGNIIIKTFFLRKIIKFCLSYLLPKLCCPSDLFCIINPARLHFHDYFLTLNSDYFLTSLPPRTDSLLVLLLCSVLSLSLEFSAACPVKSW